ncbi:MAG: hypothetical protein KTR32_29715 [Granulosicoccus sp.]|nr:hypothetical protein [Granulosicoccus sp.]
MISQMQVDPLWDEGISTFLLGEWQKKEQPLSIYDLQNFANTQAVRVGDLLETLYLMAIYGAWQYCDEEGKCLDVDADALDVLYAKGRICPDDLEDFGGLWSPTSDFVE